MYTRDQAGTRSARSSRRRLRPGLTSLGAAIVLLLGFSEPAVATAPPVTTFHAWNTVADFQSGRFEGGAQLIAGHDHAAVTLRPGSTSGTWTSPAYAAGAPIGDLVSSWQAATPTDSWIETQLSVQVGGHWSTWYQMGKWASENTPGFQRTSVNGQGDADGTVYTDTYVAGDNGQPRTYRLKVVLHGTSVARPNVFQLAATTSNLTTAPATSRTTVHRTMELDVPAYSQEPHAGEYPAFGGGGEVWCSPTSTAMVLAYWHRGPSAAALASLPADPVFDAHHRRDPQVDWAALHTWDAAYEGTGNWPFNTAYAATYGLDSSVRQYASLVPLEQWIQQSVPEVISIAWDNTDALADNNLDGAPIPKSGGHLMVVRGFTAAGDVIANDPAAPDNASVRRTYQRSQFEHNWLSYGSGAAYIVKP